jgi:GTP-binding protein
MNRSTPLLPTSLRLSSHSAVPTPKQIQLSTKFFAPAPILRFTVGKFSQLPAGEGPEVAVLGRSNVGVPPWLSLTQKSSLLNALFPAAPQNFARVSSQPGYTKTLNGYTVPNKRFTIVDLPGYGYRGREEWGREVYEYLRGRREY